MYENNRIHEAIKDLSFNQFIRILEEIAISAWHGGDVRTTTINEIYHQIEKNNLAKYFLKFQEGAKKGITRLLIAFFFQEYASNEIINGKTFEFTHKSFGEYLIARRLVIFVHEAFITFQRSHQIPEIEWDEQFMLRKWFELFGPSEITEYLFGFIQDEIRQKFNMAGGIEELLQMQKMIISFLNRVIRSGFPNPTLRKKMFNESKECRNAEEALFIFHAIISKETGKLSNVDWPEETSFWKMLNRLQIKVPPTRNVINNSLNSLNVSNQKLNNSTFYLTDLSNSFFERSKIEFSFFVSSNLRNSNFSYADLFRSSFTYARLNNAIFKGAFLQRSSFKKADLTEANLVNADLVEADLKNAILKGAKLRKANLERADLRGADLRGADFRECNLRDAKIDMAAKNILELSGVNKEILNQIEWI